MCKHVKWYKKLLCFNSKYLLYLPCHPLCHHPALLSVPPFNPSYFTYFPFKDWLVGGGLTGRVLVAVCTSGYFIVLLHWETKPPAPWPNIPHSYIIPTLSPFLILIILSCWLGSDKYQSLSHWLDYGSNSWVRIHDLPKRETEALLIRPSRLILL